MKKMFFAVFALVMTALASIVGDVAFASEGFAVMAVQPVSTDSAVSETMLKSAVYAVDCSAPQDRMCAGHAGTFAAIQTNAKLNDVSRSYPVPVHQALLRTPSVRIAPLKPRAKPKLFRPQNYSG